MKALNWAVPCAVVAESNSPWNVPAPAELPFHGPVTGGVENSAWVIAVGMYSELDADPEHEYVGGFPGIAYVQSNVNPRILAWSGATAKPMLVT